ncbi:hypothetical protein [Methylobacterium platani]|uniref:Uncharacterized protein n=2 Tax=Methylobacterium platani TaxID=427683 RepID=A0A179SHK1_9HYPH|nr:hypothetical protein [Methylobacterium platani]KMO20714.1 hypothetical protein SQ03_05050 [Methylobacterium platani JCM 14648]OAS25988.1 hypothetical protein A5481_07440 [Methylobacterium platani]
MAGFSNDEYEQFLRGSGGASAGTRPRNAPVVAPNPFAPPGGGSSAFDPAEYEAFLSGSAPAAPAATFAERFAGPTARTADTSSSALGRALQARADEALVGPASAGNAGSTALRQFANTAALNIPRNVAAGIATLAGNGATFDQNYQLARDQDAALARQNPKSALAGDVAGIVGGAVTLPGLSGASTPLRRAGQAAVTGFGYGAAGELLDSKDIERAGAAGLVGGAAGGTLGLAIEKAGPPLLRLIQGGKLVRDASGAFTGDAVNALQSAGLDPATFTPEFAGHIEQAFRAKGVSPAAIREAQAAEFGIPLSRGQATQDPAALALERQSAAGSRGGRALDVAADFGQRQAGAIDAARTGLLGRLAGNAPAIDNPAVAGEMVADRARGMAGDAAFRAAAAQRSADTALERVRGPMPPDPLDAASSVMQGVRDAAGQGKAAYRSAYDDVAAIPGEFAPGALDRMGARVQRGLGAEYPVDPVLTPAAHRALQDLDNLPGLFGAEPGTGPDLRQLDQVRKRLVALRSGTGANATDRRAMGKILEEFDGHTQAALEAGLFGPRQAARATDDFPGLPSGDTTVIPFPGPAPRERAPESLVQWLGRQGGIRLTGDTRAADLHRVMTGTGPLARMNGRPLDELRVPLMEEGFLPPDADGGYARNITNELMDAIRRERAGEPVYRASDAQRAANLDRGGRAADADADAAYAERVGEYAQRTQMELEASGLRPRDLDPAALRDAAESMMLGQVDDAATAYERAVMSGPAGGPAARPAAPEAAPFPGEGATAPAASAALPGGSSAPFEAMQKARGLFSDYQRTFKPNGPGDDVGRAVQRIVERDAQPGEVASMLFGGSRAGNTGLSVRMAERMRNVLGEDSPGWQAVQQGLISKAIEGRGGDVGARLDHLLTGEGRTLASRVLTPEQRAGLAVYRRGLAQAEAARTSLPGWVGDLARTGFDPNRVAAGLFGSGVPGSRIGSAEYGKTLKQAFGADSPEWANLRQAAWLNLVGHGEGGRLPAAKEAERIRAFTGGEGKGLAREMFNGDELALMNRYADAVKATHVPTGSRLPDGGRSAALAGQVMNLISGAIGFKVGGPAGGAAAFGARLGQRILEGGLNGVRAARSFDGGAPRVRPPLPAVPSGIVPKVAVGAGILPFGALRMP